VIDVVVVVDAIASVLVVAAELILVLDIVVAVEIVVVGTTRSTAAGLSTAGPTAAGPSAAGLSGAAGLSDAAGQTGAPFSASRADIAGLTTGDLREMETFSCSQTRAYLPGPFPLQPGRPHPPARLCRTDTTVRSVHRTCFRPVYTKQPRPPRQASVQVEHLTPGDLCRRRLQLSDVRWG